MKALIGGILLLALVAGVGYGSARSSSQVSSSAVSADSVGGGGPIPTQPPPGH